MLLSDDSSITPAAFAENLYTAQTLEEIYEHVSPELIEFVEPNYICELFDAPNDTYYTRQWYAKTIDIEPVWESYTNLKDVTVAVIDSGLVQGHEDFDYKNSIIGGYNTITKSDDIEDTLGHGSFVTGIIAAVRNNSKGIAGLASNAKIVPIKAFSEKTSTLAVVCDAIYCAVDEYDSDIINMSFGFSQNPEALKTAIEYAASKGTILVAAAGNSGAAAIQYPAGYDSVIGVGATDKKDLVCSFSQFNQSVFVTAPGTYICGISLTQNPEGTYYKMAEGTSFSAPIVSAIAAVAKGINPDMTAEYFAKLLSVTSKDLGEEGRDDYYGYGRVSAEALLKRLTNPVIAFPDYVRVTHNGVELKSGASVANGEKITLSCTLPSFFAPRLYVNGKLLESTDIVTVAYNDIEITVKHKGLSLDAQSDGSALVGGYTSIGEQNAATVLVACYSDDGRMTELSIEKLSADSNGYICIPAKTVCKDESCKVFVFSNLESLSLASLTTFE